MDPAQALARWGRHLPSCPRDEDNVPTYFPNEGDTQWWFEQNPCTCDLDAERARQAEWARLAEAVERVHDDVMRLHGILVGRGVDECAGACFEAVAAVTLARRLRGEKE